VPGLRWKSGAVGRGRELKWRFNRIRLRKIFEEEANKQETTK
jgi:hypothetical protein